MSVILTHTFQPNHAKLTLTNWANITVLKLSIVRTSLLSKLGEHSSSLGGPPHSIWLHLASLDTLQASKLLLDGSGVLVTPFVHKGTLLVRAPSTGVDVAKRCLARRGNIVLHELLIAQLIAHGLVCALGIGSTLISSLLVEVLDGWPTASTRIMVA